MELEFSTLLPPRPLDPQGCNYMREMGFGALLQIKHIQLLRHLSHAQVAMLGRLIILEDFLSGERVTALIRKS